jgi:hypothetical protein
MWCYVGWRTWGSGCCKKRGKVVIAAPGSYVVPFDRLSLLSIGPPPDWRPRFPFLLIHANSKGAVGAVKEGSVKWSYYGSACVLLIHFLGSLLFQLTSVHLTSVPPFLFDHCPTDDYFPLFYCTRCY